MTVLEQELKTYLGILPELISEQGKYVVIRGAEVAGTWETYDDALQEAYRRYHRPPFLVKKIEAVEQMFSFSRDVDPCRR